MTKQISKDPFEVAFEQEEDYDEDVEEQQPQQQNHHHQQQQQSEEEGKENEKEKEKSSPSPPQEESSIRENDEIMVDNTRMIPSNKVEYDNDDDDYDGELNDNNVPSSSTQNNNNNNNKKKRKQNPSSGEQTSGKNKEDEEEEEEDNMDVELGKFNSSGDPDKMAKMQAILSQFTEEQMSRYESFRRSGFQKANMKKLLASITGSPKISVPMTIVVSGIAKMFVGELVETGRMVTTERGESGPIRPCHIREAYRRLKLEGKVPKKSVPRLFR